ncbi:MAG: GTPase [Candidatus Bathyarchaeia archaeon]
MPANLTAEAKSRWMKASVTKDPEEKIKALEEFLSAVPKHKGNERLRAQVKRKIATLRLEVQEKRRPSGTVRQSLPKREGAAQIVLLGLTNSGKSSLLSSLTAARPTVADYPFTTQKPTPGMLSFIDIQFQLVEAPALTLNMAEDSGLTPQTLNLTRQTDGLAIVLDMSGDPCRAFELIKSELERSGISLERRKSRVEIIKRKGISGVQVHLSGNLKGCSLEDVEELVRSYGLTGVSVRVWGEAGIDDVEEAILESTMTYKPSIVIANKMDSPNVEGKLDELRKHVPEGVLIVPVSCKTGSGLYKVGQSIFQALELIRVYTKDPNEKAPSGEPIVVNKGTVASEVAGRIHTDLQRNLKYVKVWGSSCKYPGERLGPTHILQDGDVVEFHT